MMLPKELHDAREKIRSDGVASFVSSAATFARGRNRRRRFLLKLLPGGFEAIRLYVRIGRALRPQRFTDADPFKVIWIDPSRIRAHTNWVETPSRYGRVFGGDWDRNVPRFEDVDVYQSIEARFEFDRDWEKTVLYERLVDALDSGSSVWGRTIESMADVWDHLDGIEQLYESIRDDGYRTQQELYSIDARRTELHNNDAAHPLLNEIGVDIGRDGEIYWSFHGLHRLSVAKCLDIPEVPVQVLSRHRRWQITRDELRRKVSTGGFDGIQSSENSHPDLQDILGEERSN